MPINLRHGRDDHRSLFSPRENRHSSSLISPRGGDRELENEVRGENRRFRSRIGQRIDFVQRKAAHARRERNEQIEQFTDRKSTRLNSSHLVISYAVFCLKKKKKKKDNKT